MEPSKPVTIRDIPKKPNEGIRICYS